MAAVATMPVSVDQSYSALLSWAATGETTSAGMMKHELLDQDFDFSDDDSDDASDSSTVTLPSTMSSKGAPEAGSPCAVDDVVAAGAQWNDRPLRRKRKRMSVEERRVRHREVQRQFMKRKRARIAVLRKVQSGVEKQLRLVSVLQEIEQLKKENDELQKQLEAAEAFEDADCTDEPAPAPKTFGDLVFSVPAEETDDVVMLTDLEWRELLDVLSSTDDDADEDASLQC